MTRFSLSESEINLSSKIKLHGGLSEITWQRMRNGSSGRLHGHTKWRALNRLEIKTIYHLSPFPSPST